MLREVLFNLNKINFIVFVFICFLGFFLLAPKSKQWGGGTSFKSYENKNKEKS